MGSGSEIGANNRAAGQMGVALSVVELDSELGATPWVWRGNTGFFDRLLFCPVFLPFPPGAKSQPGKQQPGGMQDMLRLIKKENQHQAHTGHGDDQPPMQFVHPLAEQVGILQLFANFRSQFKFKLGFFLPLIPG